MAHAWGRQRGKCAPQARTQWLVPTPVDVPRTAPASLVITMVVLVAPLAPHTTAGGWGSGVGGWEAAGGGCTARCSACPQPAGADPPPRMAPLHCMRSGNARPGTTHTLQCHQSTAGPRLPFGGGGGGGGLCEGRRDFRRPQMATRVAVSPTFSCRVAGGQRYVLSAAGSDITVSVQAPAVRVGGGSGSGSGVGGGPRAAFDVLQVLFQVMPDAAPVVALRWFGDDGGSASDAIASSDGSQPTSGAVQRVAQPPGGGAPGRRCG